MNAPWTRQVIAAAVALILTVATATETLAGGRAVEKGKEHPREFQQYGLRQPPLQPNAGLSALVPAEPPKLTPAPRLAPETDKSRLDPMLGSQSSLLKANGEPAPSLDRKPAQAGNVEAVHEAFKGLSLIDIENFARGSADEQKAAASKLQGYVARKSWTYARDDARQDLIQASMMKLLVSANRTPQVRNAEHFVNDIIKKAFSDMVYAGESSLWSLTPKMSKKVHDGEAPIRVHRKNRLTVSPIDFATWEEVSSRRSSSGGRESTAGVVAEMESEHGDLVDVLREGPTRDADNHRDDETGQASGNKGSAQERSDTVAVPDQLAEVEIDFRLRNPAEHREFLELLSILAKTSHLTQEHEEVVELSYLGFSPREAATEMNKDVAEVQKLLSDARKALRPALLKAAFVVDESKSAAQARR